MIENLKYTAGLLAEIAVKAAKVVAELEPQITEARAALATLREARINAEAEVLKHTESANTAANDKSRTYFRNLSQDAAARAEKMEWRVQRALDNVSRLVIRSDIAAGIRDRQQANATGMLEEVTRLLASEIRTAEKALAEVVQ